MGTGGKSSGADAAGQSLRFPIALWPGGIDLPGIDTSPPGFPGHTGQGRPQLGSKGNATGVLKHHSPRLGGGADPADG